MVEPDAASRPLETLDLPPRARVAFRRMRVKTLAEAARVSAEELLASKCFGPSSVQEIRDTLARFGLALRGETAGPRGGRKPPPTERDTPYDAFLRFQRDPAGNLDEPVAVLDLCARAIDGLRRAGLTTVRALLALSPGELANRLDDPLAVRDVEERLRHFGLIPPER